MSDELPEIDEDYGEPEPIRALPEALAVRLGGLSLEWRPSYAYTTTLRLHIEGGVDAAPADVELPVWQLMFQQGEEQLELQVVQRTTPRADPWLQQILAEGGEALVLARDVRYFSCGPAGVVAFPEGVVRASVQCVRRPEDHFDDLRLDHLLGLPG